MATTVAVTIPESGIQLASWTGLSGTQNGDGVKFARFPDKTVTVSGTFTGITIQGSNDATNWVSLHDPQGVVITFTAAGAQAISENPLYIRPSGNTVTNAVVTVLGIR